MTRVRIHWRAMKTMWRCWRLSRELGIPFSDVIDLEVRSIDVDTEVMLREHHARKANLRS